MSKVEEKTISNQVFTKNGKFEIISKISQKIDADDFIGHIHKIHTYLVNKGSTTIPEGSTSQVNGDGNGELPVEEDDIVYSA